MLNPSSAGAMVARQTSNLEAVGSSPTRNASPFLICNRTLNSQLKSSFLVYNFIVIKIT